jgi:hypothetical protein
LCRFPERQRQEDELRRSSSRERYTLRRVGFYWNIRAIIHGKIWKKVWNKN